MKQLKQQSAAIRAGIKRSAEREHCEPIHTTSSYVFDNSAQAQAVFAGDEEGNVYSRYTNPTITALEQRMAAMEGADAAVATASGMAAILSVVMSQLKTGDHVVLSRSVFGTTTGIFKNYFTRFGITVTEVDLTDLQQWQDAIQANTRLLFIESPSNPLSEVADIRALADLAHAHNSILMIDNTYCTPVLQKPLELGADVVVYSATKYLDGQGRALGGLVAGHASMMDDVAGFIRTAGPCISPFNAWIILKGLETLTIRMKAHCAGALELAEWLDSVPEINKVYYSGLPSHPQHELVKTQQSDFGGVIAFEVGEGHEDAWRFIDATELLSLTPNLGDAKSTIIHPASTTHGRLSAVEQQAAGITQNLIRVSVGLEAIEDIKADLLRGVKALQQA
ncbi:MAG: O-succinylhomoserine sulfhydrylase [Gammaproteobacteria bacterium]